MRNNLFWIEFGMIIGGIIGLAISLAQIRAIMQLLPEGKVRSRWKTLSLFIFMFIAGYILYGFLHSTVRKNSIADLVAPGILFGGAVFVYMVCSLFVKTALDLQRIYVLEDENITDPLMGIYNRRYLDRRLEEEIQRARRYDVPFSVFLLDIDHFKEVNDTHGHQIGDMILKKLGTVIVGSVRELDVVVRYGGEEILVILPSTKIVDAVELARRLRQNIQETIMVGPDPEKERPQGMDAQVPLAPWMEKERPAISVTVSIGVAGYLFSGDVDTANKLVARADQALYQAKEQGRNRVVSSNHHDNLVMMKS